MLVARTLYAPTPAHTRQQSPVKANEIEVIMCAFEQEREALRMAGTMSAKPITYQRKKVVPLAEGRVLETFAMPRQSKR